jgi:hypothetical protein
LVEITCKPKKVKDLEGLLLRRGALRRPWLVAGSGESEVYANYSHSQHLDAKLLQELAPLVRLIFCSGHLQVMPRDEDDGPDMAGYTYLINSK